MALTCALAACGEPLDKKAMLAGCEASAVVVRPDLSGTSPEYRAVVGREAIVRYLPASGDGRIVVKCKVDTAGRLRRIKVGEDRLIGEAFESARQTFADAARGR
ncbi:MAG: hypothetical protein GC201_14205 [Alphaproteobacteria bacterium]|nr:hypothetical protein [Alphaproteobacteria bacterium]